MRFTDKTAVVTGAARGIGRAVALKFAMEGARVVALDINTEELTRLKGELEAYTSDVLCLTCDISDEAAVNAAAEQVYARFGKAEILVNNAALWKYHAPFMDVPTEMWKKFFDVNVMGTMYVTRAFLGNMVENGYGRIINVASVAGVYGLNSMAPYSATKAALIAMTKSLAKEVVKKGVLVNSVSPGSVSPGEDLDYNSYIESSLPFIGRTGTDMENANLICFLASDEASYIAGQNIQIDGCRKTM
ncbi:MAG: SDR family oxidoreductase [Clostridia bacterium]|nr:SDR family oxidoreductase [Clostridia bacterium]